MSITKILENLRNKPRIEASSSRYSVGNKLSASISEYW
jgi:hypothetical protein